MAWLHIFWDLGPGGNVEHVAEHGLDTNEVEHVLRNPVAWGRSRSSGRPIVFGYTPSGDYIAVAYENLMKTPCIP